MSEEQIRFFNRNLMVLINSYSAGLKDLINATAPGFERTYVFVKYNPVSELSRYLPIRFLADHLARYQKATLINPEGKPENVFVYPASVPYMPTPSQLVKLGKRQFKSVESQIRRNHIHFDLIHAHFTWPQGYSGARIKEKYDVPLVITAHGYDIYDLPFRSEGWREQVVSVLNDADMIITVSRRNRECLLELEVEPPTTVIPNGFSADKFYPVETEAARRQLGLPMDKKIILTVGNLEEVKGHAFLIEAIEGAVRERNDLLCIIIGSGKLQGVLEEQVRSHLLSEHVIFAGRIPHHEVPVWINAADLFILPSLSEGNPLVMFETLGCGKPFISTDVGGISDVITGDDYGLLMQPGDPDQMKERILTALDRHWDRERIVRYAGRFSWENLAEQTSRVYERLLA